MATGATGGVTFLSNLPPDQFQMNPAAFQQATERQDIPQQSQPFLALGTPIQIRMQNVGVLAMIRLNVTGTLVRRHRRRGPAAGLPVCAAEARRAQRERPDQHDRRLRDQPAGEAQPDLPQPRRRSSRTRRP